MAINIFKRLFVFLAISFIVVSIIIFSRNAWAAWTSPTVSPPNNNVDIPIYKDASGNVIIQLGI